MKPILIWISLIYVIAQTAYAQPYPNALTPGLSLRYEHKNQKSQQVTGYSELSYKQINPNLIEEHLKNQKINGYIFQEKISQFDAKGNLLLYIELDHRNGLHVEDRYQNGQITTFISKAEQSKDLVTPQSPGLVPFETLIYYLRAHLDQIQKGKKLDFTLFLPQIGLNVLGITQIGVSATLEKKEQVHSPRGLEPALTLLITPSNSILKALLPDKKGQFRFTFLSTPPRLLYRFSESKTTSRLVQINDNGQIKTMDKVTK